MLAIAIGLVSHSYSLSSLFPYVGYMVQQLGVAEDKDEAGQSVFVYQRLRRKLNLFSLSLSLPFPKWHWFPYFDCPRCIPASVCRCC